MQPLVLGVAGAVVQRADQLDDLRVRLRDLPRTGTPSCRGPGSPGRAGSRMLRRPTRRVAPAPRRALRLLGQAWRSRGARPRGRRRRARRAAPRRCSSLQVQLDVRRRLRARVSSAPPSASSSVDQPAADAEVRDVALGQEVVLVARRPRSPSGAWPRGRSRDRRRAASTARTALRRPRRAASSSQSLGQLAGQLARGDAGAGARARRAAWSRRGDGVALEPRARDRGARGPRAGGRRARRRARRRVGAARSKRRPRARRARSARAGRAPS